MLMDLFYEALPSSVLKKRTHFHQFMLEVHRSLRDHSRVADPLAAVAEQYTRSGRVVLCLDEFMVTDVADAALLQRLFFHLFRRGLVLVSTSNRAPDRLYEGGLQRSLFLPFIALLKERCEVHDIQGSRDYRLLAHKLTMSMFFTGSDAGKELQQLFDVFAGGAKPAPAVLPVAMGRELHVPRAANGVAWFAFADAFERAVSAADYLALVERFHTILIDGVPRFNAASRSACYRLVTLVDVAYEHHVRLAFAAAAAPAELFDAIYTHAEYRALGSSTAGSGDAEPCVDDTLGFVKQRTISRLIEMGSQEYARHHATAHAPCLLPSLPDRGQRV